MADVNERRASRPVPVEDKKARCRTESCANASRWCLRFRFNYNYSAALSVTRTWIARIAPRRAAPRSAEWSASSRHAGPGVAIKVRAIPRPKRASTRLKSAKYECTAAHFAERSAPWRLFLRKPCDDAPPRRRRRRSAPFSSPFFVRASLHSGDTRRAAAFKYASRATPGAPLPLARSAHACARV